MTTMATVFGHFPLTLVSGPGAEARNSIGLVLVGGMAIGTVFTLFFIPSIYMLIARDRSEARSSSAEATSPEEEQPPSWNHEPPNERTPRPVRTESPIRRTAHALSVALLIALGLALPAPRGAEAQQPLSKFLNAASSRALDVRRAEASKHEAEATRGIALGRMLPSATATGTYLRNQFEVSFESAPGVRAVFQEKNQYIGEVSLSMPLVDFRVWADYLGARKLATFAELNVAQARLQVHQQVVQQWYQLVSSNALILAAESNVALTEESMAQSKARVEAGASSPLELSRATAENARAVQALEDAKLQRDLAARALFDLSGIQPSNAVVQLEAGARAPGPLRKWLERAAQSPTVKAAYAAREVEKSGRVAAWLDLVPSIRGSFTESATTAPGFSPSSQWVAAITATWTLDFEKGANIAAETAQFEGAQVDAEKAEQQVRTAIFESWNRVQSSMVALKAATASLEASDKASRDARLRYDAGAGTQLEQIQADRDRFNAEVTRIQALGNLAVAKAALRLQAGLSAE